ncbi:hypothetical protein QTP88_010757 [Uroleucon formosanum]
MSWDSIMKEVVSIINFIRSNGLNHKQFQSVLIEINAEYGDVLYYTAVRWLSRGRVLERFFVLRQEIYNFLKEKGKDASMLENQTWISELAFCVDILKCGVSEKTNTLRFKSKGFLKELLKFSNLPLTPNSLHNVLLVEAILT